jgi:hypothetical protein
MTTRRRLLLLGLLTGLLALGASVWLLWPRQMINQVNADKIQKGMTLADVEKIFDGSARDESSGTLAVILPDGVMDQPDWVFVEEADRFRGMRFRREGNIFVRTQEARPQDRFWISDHLMIRVEFDEELVCACHSLPVRRVQSGILDILRRQLGL